MRWSIAPTDEFVGVWIHLQAAPRQAPRSQVGGRTGGSAQPRLAAAVEQVGEA